MDINSGNSRGRGNAALRAARWQKRWTQEQLAHELTMLAARLHSAGEIRRLTSISVRQVRRWEGATPPWPHPGHRLLLEKLFARPLSELGFTPAYLRMAGAGTASAEVFFDEDRESLPCTGQVLAHGDPRNPGDGGGRAVPGLAAPLRGSSEHPPAEHGKQQFRELFAMVVSRARQFAYAASLQTGLAPEILDQIRQDVQALASGYQRRPLPMFLGELATLQDMIFTLLERPRRPNEARELYFLAGVSSGLLGKASHDLGDPLAAMTQARTAFLCADNADHDGLRAWLRGLQSLVAYWAGRPNDAIRYARQGAEYAARVRNTAMVWIAMNEARGWAVLGDAAKTMEAIRRAESAWDDVRPDDLDEFGGIATFNYPRFLYYAADALIRLPGMTEKAAGYAFKAVSAYRDEERPEWAFGDQAGSLADLAIVHIHRGEVEGAAETLTPVLDLPPERRMHGIVQSLDHVRKVLTRSPADDEKTRDLQERIEHFMRVPLSKAVAC